MNKTDKKITGRGISVSPELGTAQQLADKDADYLLHPASSITALVDNGPQMIVGSEGCYIVDANGQRLLDAVGGLWCVNVGYGRVELANAMSEAAQQLGYYHTFSNASNPWQVALAEKLIELAPDGLDKIFLGSSGSDANDTLIKVAWHYHALRGNPNKVKVIARDQAYHGTSISTAGLTGLGGFHLGYPLPLDFILRTECPHFYTRGKPGETERDFCDRLIQDVAELIAREGADNIAAFFAEPIHAAGGIIEPPEGYYPRLKVLLEANDILLVADEVVCGFGRLGQWFGSPGLGLQADMMSTAKGLTSGYFPLSAAFTSNEIWSVLAQGSERYGAFYHGYTYSGHPVGCAVALANLKLIEEEGLVEQARLQGEYLHTSLHDRFDGHPKVGEIRGRGLLAGLQLVSDKTHKVLPEASGKWPLKVTQAARKRGLVVRPLPSVATLALSPPLTISRKEIDTIVTVLDESLGEL